MSFSYCMSCTLAKFGWNIFASAVLYSPRRARCLSRTCFGKFALFVICGIMTKTNTQDATKMTNCSPSSQYFWWNFGDDIYHQSIFPRLRWISFICHRYHPSKTATDFCSADGKIFTQRKITKILLLTSDCCHRSSIYPRVRCTVTTNNFSQSTK